MRIRRFRNRPAGGDGRTVRLPRFPRTICAQITREYSKSWGTRRRCTAPAVRRRPNRDPDIGTQEDICDDRADDQLGNPYRVADEHRTLEEPRLRCEAVAADGAGVSHRHEAIKHRSSQTDRAPLGEDSFQETWGGHPGPDRPQRTRRGPTRDSGSCTTTKFGVRSGRMRTTDITRSSRGSRHATSGGNPPGLARIGPELRGKGTLIPDDIRNVSSGTAEVPCSVASLSWLRAPGTRWNGADNPTDG